MMNVNIHITIYDTGINRARFYTSCYATLLVMSCGLGLGWHCPAITSPNILLYV